MSSNFVKLHAIGDIFVQPFEPNDLNLLKMTIVNWHLMRHDDVVTINMKIIITMEATN